MAPPKIDFKSSIYTRSTALIKGKLTTLKTTVEEISRQTEPLSAVQVRQLNIYSRDANKKKAEFENHWTRALGLPEDDNVADSALSADENEIDALFTDIISLIEVLLPPEAPTTPSTVSEVGGHSITPASSVRLPKLDLPRFNGNPLSWVTFVNLFDSTIHNNASLSSVNKFQYLISVLDGEPLNLVKSLNLTDANYLIAYNLLRERFHNSRRLQTLHLNQILDLPNITSQSWKGLRQFVNLFTEHTQALEALNCTITNSNPLLSALILRKLDSELRKKLEGYRAQSNPALAAHILPEVEEIIRFLNTECAQTEDASIHNPQTSKSGSIHASHSRARETSSKGITYDSRKVTLVASQSAPINDKSNLSQMKDTTHACFVCEKTGHKVYSCPVFAKHTPSERYDVIKKHYRCISCLGAHSLKECRSKYACRSCNKRHHTLLHFEGSPNTQMPKSPPHTHYKSSYKIPHSNGKSSIETAYDSTVALTSQGDAHAQSQCSTVLLGTLLIKLTTADGTAHVCRALLDSGSMCDLINERTAQLLKAPRSKSEVQLTGLGQKRSLIRGQTYLNIETLSGVRIETQHPMLILDNLTVDLPRVPISQEVIQRTHNFVLADPSFHTPGPIDVVLGGALFPRLLTHEHFSLGQHMPHAVGTHFGVVLMGSAPSLPLSTPPVIANNINVVLHAVSDADLHLSLQRFWAQEEPPTKPKQTAEEELCDATFQNTHTRDKGGRYVVRLPFKESHPPLGASQPAAERRFYSLERKFDMQPQFSSLYHEFIDDYITSNHMEKAYNV